MRKALRWSSREWSQVQRRRIPQSQASRSPIGRTSSQSFPAHNQRTPILLCKNRSISRILEAITTLLLYCWQFLRVEVIRNLIVINHNKSRNGRKSNHKIESERKMIIAKKKEGWKIRTTQSRSESMSIIFIRTSWRFTVFCFFLIQRSIFLYVGKIVHKPKKLNKFQLHKIVRSCSVMLAKCMFVDVFLTVLWKAHWKRIEINGGWSQWLRMNSDKFKDF